MAVSNLMTVEIVRTTCPPSSKTGQTTGEDPARAQQPGVPARAAADIEAGDGAAGQELADRAYRRLVGGAQRLVDDGDPLEMAAHGHLRHLPALAC
jgi:hypothetical protein